MRGQDHRTIVSGAVLFVAGLLVTLYAASHYAVGTIHQIGPGMFPILLGCLLAGFGLAVAAQSLLRHRRATGAEDTGPAFNLRQLAVVGGAILGFALTVERMGIVPAIVILVGATALARDRLALPGLLVLAAGLSAMAVLIFPVLLGVPLRAVIWPSR
jgi:hypothetical protein